MIFGAQLIRIGAINLNEVKNRKLIAATALLLALAFATAGQESEVYLFPVSREGKCGYIDMTGKFIWGPPNKLKTALKRRVPDPLFLPPDASTDTSDLFYRDAKEKRRSLASSATARRPRHSPSVILK